jgi:hypothetical protein
MTYVAADIIKTGSSSGLENLYIAVRTLIFNNMLVLVFGAGGVLAVGALRVLDSIDMFALVFIAGASGAAQPLLGVFFKQLDATSTTALIKRSLLWGGIPVLLFSAICIVAPAPMAALLGAGGQQAVSIYSQAIPCFALCLPLMLVNYLLIAIYQVQGRTLAANTLMLLRCFVAPVAFAGLFAGGNGLDGFWLCFAAGEATGLLYALLYSIYVRMRDSGSDLRTLIANDQRKNKTGWELSPLFLTDRSALRLGQAVSLSVRNDPAQISAATGRIQEFCDANNLQPKLAMALSLASEELLVAMGAHSLDGGQQAVMDLRLLLLLDMAVLRIRCAGRHFNPLDWAALEQDGGGVGGATMGIKMIEKMAISIDYRTTFGINNLTVVLG